MATSDDLFWPSLYSRLAPSRYLGPDYREEPEDDLGDGFGLSRYFTDFDTLRSHIEVELESLLNASCLEAALLGAELNGLPADTVKRSDYPFEAYPRVQRSIINYGMPALIGRNAYALPISLIEERLRRAVTDFEPRIRSDTMQVKVISAEGDKPNSDRPLEFVVSGEIMGADGSMQIIIDSLWDPEKIRSHVKIEH